MKAFLKILALCLLLATLTSCHAFDRWRGPCSIWPLAEPSGSSGGTVVTEKFSSTEGRFRIGLPAGNRKNDDKTFTWLIINLGEVQVVYTDREWALDTPEVSAGIFNNYRQFMLKRGKLTVDSEISLAGHPGREFRTVVEGTTAIQRIYLAGNRMYAVSIIVPKSLSCRVDAAVKVLDTFEITE